jgi:ferric-dicitrate binding protein FerR (iron transport regulator)
VENPEADSDLTVHAGPATIVLAGARAQMSMPDEDTVEVTVFKGQAAVKSEGETKQIAAGQTATFRRGGAPVDVSGAEQRWRELIGNSP